MESPQKSGFITSLWYLMQFAWYASLVATVVLIGIFIYAENKGLLPVPVSMNVAMRGDMAGVYLDRYGDIEQREDTPLQKLWGGDWGKVVGFKTLLIAETRSYIRLLVLGFFKMHILGLLAVIWLLRRLVRNFRQGEWFINQNAWLVRWIGLIWLADYATSKSLNWWLRVIYIDGLKSDGLFFPSSTVFYQSNFIIPGLVMLLIGQLIAEAVKIKQENDLTI